MASIANASLPAVGPRAGVARIGAVRGVSPKILTDCAKTTSAGAASHPPTRPAHPHAAGLRLSAPPAAHC
jgi:hypothetical protein